MYLNDLKNVIDHLYADNIIFCMTGNFNNLKISINGGAQETDEILSTANVATSMFNLLKSSEVTGALTFKKNGKTVDKLGLF